jgi:FtsH-binding integral membrane protein
VTFNSRDKLNALHLLGSIVIAAIFAALAGSWPLFIVVTAALVGCSLLTGEIRPRRRRR